MKTKSELVPFCKIKKGSFFRLTRTPKRLYQKYYCQRAQVVAGPGIGGTRDFYGMLVIPVAASITVRE